MGTSSLDFDPEFVVVQIDGPTLQSRSDMLYMYVLKE
jgi:hypothetical protein